MGAYVQENVDLTFEKGVLRISAERIPDDEKRKYWHQERRFGRLERYVTLPESVDPESIEAELRSGVLHVALAKMPESQPKKSASKSAEPQLAADRMIKSGGRCRAER